MDTTRSPQQKTPGAPSAATGPATCSNSIRSGSAPSFPRPRDREEMFGSHHCRPCPASTRMPGASFPASRSAPRCWLYSPSASLAITCPYPQFRPRNSHKASTKYAISRAGKAGAAARASQSPRRPHRPAPAGTPSSVLRQRSGPAASRLATNPQNHHEPQNGHIITSDSKARPLGRQAPPSSTRARALVVSSGGLPYAYWAGGAAPGTLRGETRKVAGPAGGVRGLEDDLLSASPLVPGPDLGEDPGRATGRM